MTTGQPDLTTFSEQGSETMRVQRWSAPQCPFAIEYPLDLLNRIRQRAVEAMYSLPHGGLEIGGILFGRVFPNARAPQRIQVSAERTIETLHSNGPIFALTPAETAEVAASLERWRVDPELAALSVVGYWVSHSRGRLELTTDDLDLYKQAFPNPWQVVLVLKPENGGPTRANFHYRAGGRVSPPDMRTVFFADPQLAGVQPPPEALEPAHDTLSGPDRYQPVARGRHTALDTFAEPNAPTNPEPVARDFRQRSIALPIVLAIALVSALLGGGVAYSFRDFGQDPGVIQGPIPDLNLEMFLSGSNLLIHWNGVAPEVQSATRGELTIMDGDAPLTFPLDTASLRQGYVRYTPHEGRVSATLKVFAQDGTFERAGAQYTGQ